MFKISTKSEFTVKGTLGESKVSFTFARSHAEDKDAFMDSVENSADMSKSDRVSYYFYKHRTALIGWTGLADEKGIKLPLYDKDGKVIEEFQKAVFDVIVADEVIWKKVLSAFDGLSAKN